MYKIIRFYNQNRKQIIRVIAIITFIIVLIQMLNYIYKNKTDNNNQNYISENTNSNIGNLGTIVSNKSAITDTKINSEKLKDDVTIINEFIESCNERNIEKAYNLLSDECKEEMYPTENEFYDNYYMSV